jgi:hypothetical protein
MVTSVNHDINCKATQHRRSKPFHFCDWHDIHTVLLYRLGTRNILKFLLDLEDGLRSFFIVIITSLNEAERVRKINNLAKKTKNEPKDLKKDLMLLKRISCKYSGNKLKANRANRCR